MSEHSVVRNIVATHFCLLICVFAFLFSTFSAHGQTNLNVGDYGAVGDAVGFSVNTESNSTVVSVAGTNLFSSGDVGKIIEVFRAGPWLQWSNDPSYMTTSFYGNNPNNPVIVTQQDIVCLITNVSEGTNLSLSIPCGWTTNTYCIVGTNNAGAFQAAINTASNLVASGQATNVTINIPAGTYLLVNTNLLNVNLVANGTAGVYVGNEPNFPALTISCGGITFNGQSASNTILMAEGAGMEHVLNSADPYGNGFFTPLRGVIFECYALGPSQPIVANQYPLVFNNLTFDGGLTNGYETDNQYAILTVGNGDGWDQNHHAVLDFGWDGAQMHQLKEFENCIFQHWRGEMLISGTGTGGTNTFIGITNCVFNDGDASAFNFSFSHSIVGCSFSNVVKVLEYYESYALGPCLFESNLCCNLAAYAKPFAIVGSVTNVVQQPYSIIGNNFTVGYNGLAIQISPAENLTISNNVFNGGGTAVFFDSAGMQPANGTASAISNVVINGNTINNNNAIILGYSVVENCLVSNNVSTSGSFLSAYGGFVTNFIMAGNWDTNGGQDAIACGSVSGGDFPLDLPGNTFSPALSDDGNYNQTNEISYSNGRYHCVRTEFLNNNGVPEPDVFYCDANPLTPPGAQLWVRNSGFTNLCLYYDSSLTGYTNIASGTMAILYWNGSSWGLPLVSFTVSPTSGVAALKAQFSSPTSDNASNAIVGRNWSFGDGSTSSTQNPSHTYTNVGTFYASLTVTNVLHQVITSPQMAITTMNPAVQFSAKALTGVSRMTAQFTSPTVDSGTNTIKSWFWKFGDGSSGTTENPSHIYTNVGTFYPVLVTTNAYGLAAVSPGVPITVTNPVIQFTEKPVNGASRLNVQFTSPSVDSGSNAIKSWSWKFGDGSSGTTENPSHTYTNLGTFYASLTVTNVYGIVTAGTNSAITVTNPVIKFTATPTNAYRKETIQFTSPGTDSGSNTITKWQWSFGDGAVSTLQNPTHSYTNSGTYHPVLAVANVYGLVPVSSGPAINVSSPSVSFSASPTNGVSLLKVQFKSPASDSLGLAIKNWQWNFGDGSKGSGENPAHSYTNIGTFYPVLTVSNSIGLWATNIGEGITVTNPIIKFTCSVTNGTGQLAVRFTSPGKDSGTNTIKSWNWNFGDGQTGTGENPSHTYTTAGTFYPVLMATNSYGISPTSFGPAITVNETAAALEHSRINSPPPLSIAMNGPNAILKWPTNTNNCMLQYSTDPASAKTWTAIGTAPVVVSGQNNITITNFASAPRMFFRLSQ